LAVLEAGERRVLSEADEALSNLQKVLEDAARSGALDAEMVHRLVGTMRELAARVNDSLSPEVDPRAADEIRRRLIAVLTLSEREDETSLDIADKFLMEIEAVRHVLRDLVDEQPPAELRDAGAVIRLLEEWLPRLSVNQLSDLLGFSPRQLQRRRRDGGPSTHRAELVARLIAILRHGWTDEGVAAWFYRPRRDLDDRRPFDLLDDARFEGALLTAARSGRVQGGV
jgi:uncharacterized protein (DUF2384 family)